jgi:hypothetical protein
MKRLRSTVRRVLTLAAAGLTAPLFPRDGE